MKKLITALAALSLVASTSVSVVACSALGNTTDNGDALPNTEFALESDSMVIDVKNPGSLKITNWDILNDSSKPTKFTYDQEGIIQMTPGLNGDLVATPSTGAKKAIVSVTVESEVASKVIKVYVNEIVAEDAFVLDTNSLEMNTNEKGYLNVTNWDALENSLKPAKFEVDSDYAKIDLDSPNHRLIVSSNSIATNSVVATITDENNYSVYVTLKINANVFDLADESLVSNIAAGNMEDGLIDPTYAVGVEGFKITDESVITGFNILNNVNFSSNDVEVIREGDGTSEGNYGIGASYILRAKEGSTVVKGEKTLTLNQGIDPLQYFANKNLGEIRLFSGALNHLDEALADTKNSVSLASVIFEQVGVRNPQLQYFKANFVNGGLNAAGKEIMANSKVSSTIFQITDMPTVGSIFKGGVDVQFTYKFIEEDRITISEGLPESGKLKVDADLLVKNTKVGQRDAKTQMYEQLNETFKSKITLENFITSTNIIFDTKNDSKESVDFKLDILPNSEKLYGHDGAAFNGYMFAGWWGSITSGGNLSVYEESGAIPTKYSEGMGYFDLGGATSGNFYQGHDIMQLNQTQSSDSSLTDISIAEGETELKDFTIENMKEDFELTLETVNGNFKGELDVTLDSSSFDPETNSTSGVIKIVATTKSTTGQQNVTVNLKINGYTAVTFKVTITAAA